jgi:hypothetical protein
LNQPFRHENKTQTRFGGERESEREREREREREGERRTDGPTERQTERGKHWASARQNVETSHQIQPKSGKERDLKNNKRK